MCFAGLDLWFGVGVAPLVLVKGELETTLEHLQTTNPNHQRRDAEGLVPSPKATQRKLWPVWRSPDVLC